MPTDERTIYFTTSIFTHEEALVKVAEYAKTYGYAYAFGWLTSWVEGLTKVDE